MSTIETANKLREAAELIGENGHTIGTYQDAKGQLCLHGALAKAHGLGAEAVYADEVTESMNALIRVLPDRCSDPKCKGNRVADGKLYEEDIVYHYNDFHCDGGAGAIEVLVQAAEKIEADL